MNNDFTNEILNEPRFQEGGAGRFASALFKRFPDFDLTAEQMVWIENYYQNVSDKNLW